MSNYKTEANLELFTFNSNNSLKVEDISQIFDIDLDFKENREFFREDTIKLGYKNESERCANELLNKHKKNVLTEDQVEAIYKDIINYKNGKTCFIIGNPNCCKSHTYKILRVNDIVILTISYVS